MRRLARLLAEHQAVAAAVALAERLDRASPRILRVLTYHRVDEPLVFARQMEHLAARSSVVSVAQVLSALEDGPSLPPRAVLLTFDDGYESFARVALPVLRRHRFAAALFVPTAYPASDEPLFWWDRLDRACASTARREPLETPVGLLGMRTPGQRSRAHELLRRHVKELPHRETLATVAELCERLGDPGGRHEVLGWDELRALAAEGVVLGAHSRTHPRLDRVPLDEARDEILGSLADLEREVPGQPRLFAYPDGRFDEQLVEIVHAARVELAFTTRRGTNDLHALDRLRLRRIPVDARDSLAVFRAKLALSSARLGPVMRLLDPPSRGERAAESECRRGRLRSRFLHRALDASLTAELRPRGSPVAGLRGLLGSGSRYERFGKLTRLATAVTPGLAPLLGRALLDPSRLPFRDPSVRVVGFGSGATVFRLEAGAGAPPLALKVYRRTIGREPERQAAFARRQRACLARLRERFGGAVLPGEFLVLHGPLRARAAVACLQPFLDGRLHDVLALDEARLVSLLSSRGLTERFEVFARSTLEWRARGLFPDLFGSKNLLVHETPERAELWLIDYAVFRLEEQPASIRLRAGALCARLGILLERIRELPAYGAGRRSTSARTPDLLPTR